MSKPSMSSPKVGIIMGSSSDLSVMQQAANILEEFDIDSEVSVVSAHRTPEAMMEYAATARDRGLVVIIAGAGGAAHLPGMVASVTTLPVIGVPIRSSNSIDGWDSVLPVASSDIENNIGGRFFLSFCSPDTLFILHSKKKNCYWNRLLNSLFRANPS